MFYLRKLVPLAALLALVALNTPLLAQESASRQPTSPSSSPQAESTPAEADSWGPLARQLEAENRRLVEERDHWQAEAIKCQARLERAEHNLSWLTAKAFTAAEDPEVQVTGNEVVVTVRMLNIGDQPSVGTASINLLLDNKVVATAKEPVNIPAGSGLSVTHRFSGVSGKGKFTAKMSFDP
jgi:hypothetical protein